MTKKNEAAPASVKANGAANTSADTYHTTNANMYSCEKQISHENDEHGATLDAQAPVVPANQQAKASAAPAKVLRLDRHEVDRSAPVRGRIAQMTVDLGRKPTPAELVDRVNTPLSILIIERATGLLFVPKIKPFDAGTPESDQAREEWESWHAAYIANRMPTKLAYPAVAEEITRVLDEYTDGSDPGVHKLSNVLDWCFDFTEVESEWVQATDKKGNPPRQQGRLAAAHGRVLRPRVGAEAAAQGAVQHSRVDRRRGLGRRPHGTRGLAACRSR